MLESHQLLSVLLRLTDARKPADARATCTETGLCMRQVGGKGGPCGLAHISEVADGFAADIHGQFHAGQGAHLLADV